MSVVDYIVCPRCGNNMRFLNGKWYCRVCGYVSPGGRGIGKVKNLYTPRKLYFGGTNGDNDKGRDS